MDTLLIAEPLFSLIAVPVVLVVGSLWSAKGSACRVEAMTGDARPGRR